MNNHRIKLLSCVVALILFTAIFSIQSFAGDGHDHAAKDSHAGHDHSSEESQAIDWCPEHSVPESECTKCHPALVANFKEKGDWCNEHGVPESHCYKCHPTLSFAQEAEYKKLQAKSDSKKSDKPKTTLWRSNKTHCATEDAVIELKNTETAERAGLKIETVQESPASAVIEAPAEVEFDASSAYAVTSLVSGTIVKWVVQPGEEVSKGQVLAYLESIEGASLKAEYAHAAAMSKVSQAAYDREKELSENELSSVRDLQVAEADYLRNKADLRKASSSLKALGYTDNALAELENDDSDESMLALRAKHSGILVEQKVELGSVLQAGESIGMISEPNRFWVEAQVRENELYFIKKGMAVSVSLDGEGLERVPGVVSWVSAIVDEQTKMGKARIQVNSQTDLHVHQFVHVIINTSPLENSVMVPMDAVQWEGCCNVVFVQDAPTTYKPHKVTVEFSNGSHYAIRGIKSGDKIVTKGSYMLKTELMKSSIGAGCCGEGS